VGLEWDEASKVRINYCNQAIRRPEAVPVLDEPHAITIESGLAAPRSCLIIRRFVRKNGRCFFLTLSALVGMPLAAQRIVDTAAGGVIRSGVSALVVPIGAAAGLARDGSGNMVFG